MDFKELVMIKKRRIVNKSYKITCLTIKEANLAIGRYLRPLAKELSKYVLEESNMLGIKLGDGSVKLYSLEDFMFLYGIKKSRKLKIQISFLVNRGVLALIEVSGKEYYMMNPVVFNRGEYMNSLVWTIFSNKTLNNSVNLRTGKVTTGKPREVWEKKYEA